MTFSVFSLFVLACFSIPAADPAGIKIRITDKGLNSFKDVGLALLRKLTYKPIPKKFNVPGFDITGLMFKQLTANSDKISLTLQSGSLVKISISDLMFEGNVSVNNNNVDFNGEAKTMNIDVKLTRKQDHLAVEIPNCAISGANVKTKSDTFLGMIPAIIKAVVNTFNCMICWAVKKFGIPALNKKLESLTSVTKVYQELGISMDFSLAGDIASTPQSLDIPFKGLVFPDDGEVPTGLPEHDPVIPENDHMVYVGASESFFTSTSQALYNKGALTKTTQVENKAALAVLKAIQIIRQPRQLLNPLYGTLGVTEAPAIRINTDGVTVTAKVKWNMSPESPTNEKKLFSNSIALMCKVQLQGSVAKGSVEFSTKDISCTSTDSGVVINNMISFMAEVVKLFYTALRIPLPLGLEFNFSHIYYSDGYLVAGGSMDLDPDTMELVVDNILQQMSSVFESSA